MYLNGMRFYLDSWGSKVRKLNLGSSISYWLEDKSSVNCYSSYIMAGIYKGNKPRLIRLTDVR